MKRFAIICEDLRLDQQTQLAAYFGEYHFGFWHRLTSCWLLVCPDDVSAMSLRENLVELLGADPNFLVLDVFTWSSSIPPEWHEWFFKFWNGETAKELLRRTQGKDATQE